MEEILCGVQETLLAPLWARAAETQRPDGIIRDEWAVKLTNSLDYDFGQFQNSWMSQVGVAIRTELLDKAAGDFIRKHPRAVVMNLGCGLDTRFYRLDNGLIQWVDLDLAEPLRLRRRFFQETTRHRMLERSAFDPDWIRDAPRDGEAFLIIAEGLLMYFPEAEVKALLQMLATGFPQAEMLLETLAPMLVRRSQRHDMVKGMAVDFRWGPRSGKEIEKLDSRIEVLQEWNYFDFHRDRWRWLRWPALIPAFKTRFNNKIVHLRFR